MPEIFSLKTQLAIREQHRIHAFITSHQLIVSSFTSGFSFTRTTQRQGDINSMIESDYSSSHIANQAANDNEQKLRLCSAVQSIFRTTTKHIFHEKKIVVRRSRLFFCFCTSGAVSISMRWLKIKNSANICSSIFGEWHKHTHTQRVPLNGDRVMFDRCKLNPTHHEFVLILADVRRWNDGDEFHGDK